MIKKIIRLARSPQRWGPTACHALYKLRSKTQLLRLRTFAQLQAGTGTALNMPLICDGLGTISLGNNVSIGYRPAVFFGDGHIRLQARLKLSTIKIGDNVSFSNNVCICACKKIQIGNECLIGDGVLIMDSDFHQLDPQKRRQEPINDAPVIVEENVWIGSRAIILKGVTIGRDSVIAAGAVVTKSTPPRSVVAGNPARIIKTL